MLPLRWKLVGLYAVVLTAVIGAFSTALVVGWRQSLLHAMEDALEEDGREVCAMVERDRDKWFVEAKSGLGEEFGEQSGRYYVVSDRQGNVLMSSTLSSSLGLTPPDTDGVREVEVGGRSFREVTRTLTIPADEEEGLGPAVVRVACGTNMASLDSSVASLERLLAVVGPLVLFLSLGGGLWIVSRALRPIDEMARTAEQIHAMDLSQRIEVSGRDELARLGNTLNAMFDRLEESFQRQRQFTADASHELRTPLSVIAGSVELGLKRPRSVEEYREILDDVREATDRMRSIVEGLLVLARADAKSLPLLRESVSLTAVADEIVRLCRPLAEERGIRVSVESAGDVRVTGDRERLKDLVSNLVTNAIRYNRPGGTVTVSLSSTGDRVRLAVDDTGVGIPADDLPHLFERFYRVDKARSREAGGSGLGLAIAKWIVEAHRGEIEVTSRLNEGTRFLVCLPAMESPTGAAAKREQDGETVRAEATDAK